ncbi:esterase family protein [Nocardia vinacea]|nr:esterase family protein [Nocardia vinacea]
MIGSIDSTGPARVRLLCVAMVLVICGAPAAMVHAQPPQEPIAVSADGSRLDRIQQRNDRLIDISVYSAAMNTVFPAQVLRARDEDASAPTLYLLNGANGGVGGSWYDETDVADFFRDKQVNVVIPIGGAGSYFTDWKSDDPLLGRQRWTTFLTEELPPIIDRAFNGNGANAIAGLSMSATSVFQLALSAPGRYRAIGSYSGCVRTSDPQGQAFVTGVVARWRGNALNMWGPPADPAWAANDPYLHADRLRGTAIYVSAGTGALGPLDTPEGTRGDLIQLVWQVMFGVPLEAVMNMCTHQLHDRLESLGIPATFDFRSNGTHSWGYWQEDLHKSWPILEAALTE